MDIDIKPPFELNQEAWERLKRAAVKAALFLLAVLGIAALLCYLIYWIIYFPASYEGGL